MPSTRGGGFRSESKKRMHITFERNKREDGQSPAEKAHSGERKRRDQIKKHKKGKEGGSFLSETLEDRREKKRE